MSCCTEMLSKFRNYFNSAELCEKIKIAYHVESKQNFGHGNDSLDNLVSHFSLFVAVRHRTGHVTLGLLNVAELGVKIVLPRHFIGRVDFVWQGELGLCKFSNFIVRDFLNTQK